MEENTVVTTDEVKTFTQDEVNAIVTKRLAQEKAKYEGFDELKAKAEKYDSLEEANKSDLQKAAERIAALEAELDSKRKTEEVRAIREKVAKEFNIPVNLLTADTDEACIEQANAIKEFATPNYPNVRDAGEVTGTARADTRTQFADWASQAFN